MSHTHFLAQVVDLLNEGARDVMVVQVVVYNAAMQPALGGPD